MEATELAIELQEIREENRGIRSALHECRVEVRRSLDELRRDVAGRFDALDHRLLVVDAALKDLAAQVKVLARTLEPF